MDRTVEQTMALAAIVQNAFLVKQLAQHGSGSADKFATAVNSLFITKPRNTEEVFGSVKNLNLGLQALQEILEGNSSVFAADEVMKYLMSILYLQGKIMKRDDLLKQISDGLEQIKSKYPDESLADNPLAIADLAQLYQKTLSTLSYRIQVKGDMQKLQNAELAAKIRVLLFAAVRATVLWEQRGGRRWHLIFQRKRISRDVNRLLHNLT